MKKLILTEKIDAACQVAEALYHIGIKDGDFKEKSSIIKTNINNSKKTAIIGGNYVIFWTNGHLGYDLKPADIKSDYGFKFQFDNNLDYTLPKLLFEMKRDIKNDRKKFFSIVNSEFKKHIFSEYYICTDADAEGERIARDFLFRFCRLDKNANVKRMWITGSFDNPKIIKEQLETALPYNDTKYNNLYDSQRVRSTGDYIQGMKSTKILVDLYGQKLYSGRVKNTIVGLIGDRELEIKNFKPKKFYTINSIGKYKLNHFYIKETEDINSKGVITSKNERTTHYFNIIELNKVVEELRAVDLNGVVTKCERKVSSSIKRPLPLSGDDFKSEMASKYKLSLKDSGDILQYLRDQGFTTYQGTNGRYFSIDDSKIVEIAYKTALSYFRDDITIQSAKFDLNAYLFNDKEAKKQNHPPLHLTDKIPTKKDIEIWAKSKLKFVKEGYELIAKRILVHFLENDEYESIKFEVEVNKHKFDTSGIKPLKDGWRAFIDEKRNDNFFEIDFVPGDKIKLDDIEVNEKETTKPSFYTESEILNTLMNVSKVLNQQIDEETDPDKKFKLKKAKNILKNVEGIGTDRTRESIINELKDAGLLELKKKFYHLSSNGWLLYKALPPQLRNVMFTAKWEEYFEEIRRGNKTYKDVILAIDDFIKKTILYIIKNKIDVPKINKVETNLKCPLCNSNIIEMEKNFKCKENKFVDNKQIGCKFNLLKSQKLLKAKFGLKQIERILNNETLKAPNGKLVSLDLNNDFFLKIETPDDIVVETDKTYRLGDKFCFKNAFGSKLTLNQATKLLNDEEITIKRKNKQDKEYKVTIWLEENGKFGSSFN
jgi:DNA topoisomerase III